MKPQWKEGLFIMPQHFQLFDEHTEAQLDRRLETLAEYGWGIAELELDEGELARGLFRIEKCVAVMPDGMLVELDSDRTLQGVVAMSSGALVGGSQSLEVYLAIPGTESRGTANYAGDGAAAGTRFVHSVEEVPDIFGGSAEAPVDCLRPNVQLLLGHQNRQSYVCVKLAELQLGESGALKVSDDYIPPCLKIRASHAIMDRLSRLVAAMGAKQKNLAERYGGRAGNMLEFGAADMSTFWYMHTLNTWLPRLLHYNNQGHPHPEALYLELCSLAGQLNSFEVGATPEDLPAFSFLDLSATFFPLFDRLMDLLGTVVAAKYQTIDLEQVQDGVFVGKPADPHMLRTHTLFLVAGGDVDESVLRQQLPHYLKIGSTDALTQIVSAALPGVKAAIDMSPPAAIPVRAHMVYLRLDSSGEHWDAVLQSGTIAIYQPISPQRVTLELLAVPRR